MSTPPDLGQTLQRALGYACRIESRVVWDAESIMACREEGGERRGIVVLDTVCRAVLDVKRLDQVAPSIVVRLHMLPSCLVVEVGKRLHFVTRGAGDGVFNVHGVGENVSLVKKRLVLMDNVNTDTVDAEAYSVKELVCQKVKGENARMVLECEGNPAAIQRSITCSLSVKQVRRLAEWLQRKAVQDSLVSSFFHWFVPAGGPEKGGAVELEVCFGVCSVNMCFREGQTVGDLKKHVQTCLQGVPPLDCIRCETRLGKVTVHEDAVKLSTLAALKEPSCAIILTDLSPIRIVPLNRLKADLDAALRRCDEVEAEGDDYLKSKSWWHVSFDFRVCGIEPVLADLCSVLRNHDAWAAGIALSLYEQMEVVLNLIPKSKHPAKGAIESVRLSSLRGRTESVLHDDRRHRLAMIGFRAAYDEEVASKDAPHNRGEQRVSCASCGLYVEPYPSVFNVLSHHKKHKHNCSLTPFGYPENVPLSVTYASQPGTVMNESIAHVVPCVNDDRMSFVFQTNGFCDYFQLSSGVGHAEIYATDHNAVLAASGFYSQRDEEVILALERTPKGSYEVKSNCHVPLIVKNTGKVIGFTLSAIPGGVDATLSLLRALENSLVLELYSYTGYAYTTNGFDAKLEESSTIELSAAGTPLEVPVQLVNCHSLGVLVVVHPNSGMQLIYMENPTGPLGFIPYDYSDAEACWAYYSKRSSQLCVVFKDESVRFYCMLNTVHPNHGLSGDGFCLHTEVNKMRHSLEFELLPFNTYSNIPYPLKTNGTNAKWNIAEGTSNPTFLLEFVSPSIVSALHFTCSGVFHLGKLETFERKLVVLVEGEVYRTVRLKAEELSHGSGTKRFIVKQTIKTFPLVIQKQRITIQLLDGEKDKITEAGYTIQIKAFGCRNYFADAQEMTRAMIDVEEFPQFLLLVSAVPRGSRINSPAVLQAKGFEKSHVVDANFQISCTELLVALLKCGQSLKQLRSKMRTWLLQKMVSSDKKPVVHYVLLNSVLSTEQRSSYVTAQLLTQCVNMASKRHLLRYIVDLIPVAVGLDSAHRLPESLRSADSKPLCGAPNPAGLRTLFELLCACSNKTSDVQTTSVLQKALAEIGAKLHELQSQAHVQVKRNDILKAYDALRSRLDLYRSVLEPYTYEVESFYTSVKKAISEPIPRVLVQKKGRNLFFLSEKTPLFLSAYEVSPGTSLQQQAAPGSTLQTPSPVPLNTATASLTAAAGAVGEALGEGSGEAAALLSYPEHDCDDVGSCETCKGNSVALEDYGIKISGCGKQLQLQWKVSAAEDGNELRSRLLQGGSVVCFSTLVDLGKPSVVQQLSVSLQATSGSKELKDSGGHFYVSCWGVEGKEVAVKATTNPYELARIAGVTSLFQMNLMSLDVDRWKNKSSKVTLADQARVEKALKQADMLLRKSLGIGGMMFPLSKKMGAKASMKHAPIQRVLNKQNIGKECRLLLIKVYYEPASRDKPFNATITGSSTIAAYGFRGSMHAIASSDQLRKELTEAEQYEQRVTTVLDQSIQRLERDLHEVVLRDELPTLENKGKVDHKAVTNMYEKCGILQAGRTITARHIYSLRCQLQVLKAEPHSGDLRKVMDAFPFAVEEMKLPDVSEEPCWPVCSLGRLKLAGKLIARHIHKFSHPSNAARMLQPLFHELKMGYFAWLELFAHLCLYGPSRSLRKAVVRLFSPSISKLPAFVADALALYVSTNPQFMHAPSAIQTTQKQQHLAAAASLDDAADVIMEPVPPLPFSSENHFKTFSLSPVLNVLEECVCGDRPIAPKRQITESLCMYLRELWDEEHSAMQNITIWTLLLLSKIWRDPSEGSLLKETPTEHYLTFLEKPRAPGAELIFLRLIRHFPGAQSGELIARCRGILADTAAERDVREAAEHAIEALEHLAANRRTFCLETMLQMVVLAMRPRLPLLSRELQVLSLNTFIDCLLYHSHSDVYAWLNALDKDMLLKFARSGLTSPHRDVHEGTLQCFILLADLSRFKRRPLELVPKKPGKGKPGEDSAKGTFSRDRLLEEVRTLSKRRFAPTLTKGTKVVVDVARTLLKDDSSAEIERKHLIFLLICVLPKGVATDQLDEATIRRLTTLLCAAMTSLPLDTAYVSSIIRALVRFEKVIPACCHADILETIVTALATCSNNHVVQIAEDVGDLLSTLLRLDSDTNKIITTIVAALAGLCQQRGDSFSVGQEVVVRLQEFTLSQDTLAPMDVSPLLHTIAPYVRGIAYNSTVDQPSDSFVTPVSSPLEENGAADSGDGHGRKEQGKSVDGCIVDLQSFAVESFYLLRLILCRLDTADVLKAIGEGGMGLLLDILHRVTLGQKEAEPQLDLKWVSQHTSNFCELINSSRDLSEEEWKVQLQTRKLDFSTAKHAKSPLKCVLGILQHVTASEDGNRVLLELCTKKLGELMQAVHLQETLLPQAKDCRRSKGNFPIDLKPLIELIKQAIRSSETSKIFASQPEGIKTLLSILASTCEEASRMAISRAVARDIQTSQGEVGSESAWAQTEKEIFLSEADILRNDLPENEFNALERLLRISSTMQNGVRSVLPHTFKEIPTGSSASTKEYFTVDLILKRPLEVTEFFVECTTSLSGSGVPSTRLPASSSVYIGSCPDDLIHIDTRRFVADVPSENSTTAVKAYNPFKNKVGRIHLKLQCKTKCQLIRFKFLRPVDGISTDSAEHIYVPFPGACILLISRLAVKGVHYMQFAQSPPAEQQWVAGTQQQVLTLLLHVNQFTSLASLRNGIDTLRFFKLLLRVISESEDAKARSSAMKLFALKALWSELDAITLAGKHLLLLTYKADAPLASTRSSGQSNRSCVGVLIKEQERVLTAMSLSSRVLCMFCTDSAGLAKVIPWVVKNVTRDVGVVTSRTLLWTTLVKSLTRVLHEMEVAADVSKDLVCKVLRLVQDPALWSTNEAFKAYIDGTSMVHVGLKVVEEDWTRSLQQMRLVWLKFLCAIIRQQPGIYGELHESLVGTTPDWNTMLQSEGDWSSHTLRLLGVLGAASNVESLYEQKSAMAGLVLKRLDARPVNHEVVHLVGYLGDSLLDEGLVKKWLEPNIGVLLDVAFATLASSASSSAVSQAWLNVFMCTVTSPRLLEAISRRIVQELEVYQPELSGAVVDFCVKLLRMEHKLYIHLHPTLLGSQQSHIYAWQEEVLSRFCRDSQRLGEEVEDSNLPSFALVSESGAVMIGGEGTIARCAGGTIESVLLRPGMTPCSGTMSWKVLVEDVTEDTLVIGISFDEEMQGGWPGNTPQSWSLSSCGSKWCQGLHYNYTRRLRRGDIVRVVLNISKRQLSFEINGTECGVAFDNIPEPVASRPVFAAFGFFGPGQGIQIVSPPRASQTDGKPALLAEVPLFALLQSLTLDATTFLPLADIAATGMVRRLQKRKALVADAKNASGLQKGKQHRRGSPGALKLLASLVTLPEPTSLGNPYSMVSQLDCLTSASRVVQPRYPLESDRAKHWLYRPGPVLEVPKGVTFGTLACDLAEAGVLNDEMKKRLDMTELQDASWECTPCTYSFTQQVFVEQDWFHCEDCNLVGNNGCCAICAVKCHKGHNVKYRTRSAFYCDCALSDGCKGLKDCHISCAFSTSAGKLQVSAQNMLEESVPTSADIVDIAFQLETDESYSCAHEDAEADVSLSYKAARFPVVAAVISQHEGLAAVIAVLEQIISSKVALILSLNEDARTDAVDTSDSSVWKGKEENIGDWRKWLSFLQVLRNIPVFSTAFATNVDCVALVVSLLQTCDDPYHGYAVVTDELYKLYQDPCKPMVEVINVLLEKDAAASSSPRSISSELLTQGVLDLLMVRIGDLEGEAPKDTKRTKKFHSIMEDKYKFPVHTSAVKANGGTAPESAAKPPTADEVTLWKPGFGHGHAGNPEEDAERAQRFDTWRNRSVETFECVMRILEAEVGTGRSEALIAEVLESSCLLNLMHSYFFGNSVKSLLENQRMNYCLLKLCMLCTTVVDLHPLLSRRPGQYSSVFQLLQELQVLAADILELQAEEVCIDKTTEAGESPTRTSGQVNSERDFAVFIQQVFRAVEQVMSSELAENGTASPKHSAEGASAEAENFQTRYEREMKELQFGSMEFANDKGVYKHTYWHNLANEAQSKSRSKRLNRELRGFKNTLPIHFGSTIVIRVDSTRPHVIRAAIFAPQHTPYDSGCFLFDIYLPPDYPNVPPMITLITTGSGTVRFNPNLYNSGKVCLSLLGTWRGGATGNENWTKKSTLLQVLVSIQSLILGAEYPYFNEPGVEALWGTPEGELQKRINTNGGYESLRCATITHAMVQHLVHPPHGFEDVVKTHFKLKAEYILAMVASWLEEAKESDTPGYHDELKKACTKLRSCLEKL